MKVRLQTASPHAPVAPLPTPAPSPPEKWTFQLWLDTRIDITAPLGDDESDTTAHSCSVVASAATSTVHYYVATSRVQAELAQRADEAEAWRSRQVQRARQEADLARQRYRQVDPGNRLVADVLEAEWNACLRELEDAQRECERKRMARLLIEDVTMTKGGGHRPGRTAAPRSRWPCRSRRAPATATAPRPGSSLKSTRCSKTTPMPRSPGSSTIAAAAR